MIKISKFTLTEAQKKKEDINKVLFGTLATPFHTLEWNQVLIKIFKLNGYILIAYEHKKPVGTLIYFIEKDKTSRWCKSPLTSLEVPYGGSIAIKNNQKIIDFLIKFWLENEKKSNFEIWTIPGQKINLEKFGFKKERQTTLILDLAQPLEKIWQNFDKKTRNMIRKAQKNNIKINEGNLKNIDDYYLMLKNTYAPSGTLILPKKFYQEIFKKINKKLFLAFWRGIPIAGIILPYNQDTVYYWHGASYRKYRHLAPNDFLQWEAICRAKKARFKKYDFVRIDSKKFPGITHFKKGFGGKRVYYYRYTKMYQPTLIDKIKKRINI